MLDVDREDARGRPKPRAIAESFPAFPVTTLTSAIVAMLAAFDENRRLHRLKSFRFDLAFLATLAVTTVVLVSQLVVAWKLPVDPASFEDALSRTCKDSP
jgi:hypothetical protein